MSRFHAARAAVVAVGVALATWAVSTWGGAGRAHPGAPERVPVRAEPLRTTIHPPTAGGCTDAELARILEPRAPRPDLRLEALRKLREAGIGAGVICAPVLPGITDSPKQLESVVRGASEAGANYVYANPLFLKPCSAAVFMPFLRENFPKLVPDYEQRFKDRSFLAPAYRKRISELFARLREKHGIKKDSGWNKTLRIQPQELQMSLFS